jgi:hypothetical protein
MFGELFTQSTVPITHRRLISRFESAASVVTFRVGRDGVSEVLVSATPDVATPR